MHAFETDGWGKLRRCVGPGHDVFSVTSVRRKTGPDLSKKKIKKKSDGCSKRLMWKPTTSTPTS